MLHAFSKKSELLLEKTAHDFCQALKDFEIGPHEFCFYRNSKGGFFAHENLIARLDGVLSMAQEIAEDIAISDVLDPLRIKLKEALKTFLERLSLEKTKQSFDCKKNLQSLLEARKKGILNSRSFEASYYNSVQKKYAVKTIKRYFSDMTFDEYVSCQKYRNIFQGLFPMGGDAVAVFGDEIPDIFSKSNAAAYYNKVRSLFEDIVLDDPLLRDPLVLQ